MSDINETSNAPVAEPVATAPVADAAPAWASDLAALDREDWYTKLPEEVRPTIRGGLEARLKTWDKGYQTKFQTLAEERKAWESEKTKMARDAQLFDSLFKGEEDPRVSESATRLAELEANLAALTAERDSFKTKWETHDAAEQDKEATRIAEKFRDIIELKDGNGKLPAWQKFCALMETEQFTEDEAAQIVRPMFKLGQTVRPLTKALDLAGDGTSRAIQVEQDEDDLPMAVAVRRAGERAARKLGVTD